MRPLKVRAAQWTANVISKIFKGLIRERRAPEPPVVARDTGASARHWISNPWHAVSVAPCRRACLSARNAMGVRFLSKEAPTLPLTGCTSVACECRYRHHEDRRRSLRRASDVMQTARAWNGREQRNSHGRRNTDSP